MVSCSCVLFVVGSIDLDDLDECSTALLWSLNCIVSTMHYFFLSHCDLSFSLPKHNKCRVVFT